MPYLEDLISIRKGIFYRFEADVLLLASLPHVLQQQLTESTEWGPRMGLSWNPSKSEAVEKDGLLLDGTALARLCKCMCFCFFLLRIGFGQGHVMLRCCIALNKLRLFRRVIRDWKPSAKKIWRKCLYSQFSTSPLPTKSIASVAPGYI